MNNRIQTALAILALASPGMGWGSPDGEAPLLARALVSANRAVGGTVQGKLPAGTVSSKSDPANVKKIAEDFLTEAGYGKTFKIESVQWKGAEHQFWQLKLKNPKNLGHTGVLNFWPSGKIEIRDHAKMAPPPSGSR